MAFFNEFPNTRTYNKDLGWLIHVVGQLQIEVQTFIENNTINIPDQITWDITKQYTRNTLVIDYDGTAYLSKQPVPVGIAITNTDYWMPIFNYDDSINTLRDNIAANERNNTTATAERHTGELVWLGNSLYKVTADMPAGTAYLVGTNVELYTIEDYLLFLKGAIAAEAQARELADTTLQGNIDAEVVARQGADNTLQGNIDAEVLARQGADNALQENIDAIKNRPYINVKDFGAVGDGTTDDYPAFLDALEHTSEGSTIIVPYGNYYLSQNPGATKNVNWKADNGTTFCGPGIGTPDNGHGTFGCTDLSNPWIKVSGEDNKADITNVITPLGGGVYAHASELVADNTPELVITGTLTNGSSVITNVSDTSGIFPAYGIIPDPAIEGFPAGTSVGTTMRVISTTEHSITMGIDRGDGVGSFTPTVFTGPTGTYTFKIRKRIWQGIRFEGLNTGTHENRDAWSWVYNSVVNLHRQPAFQMELDFNIWDTAPEMSRCLALTGIGTGQSNVIALEINRGGSCNWSYGIQIGQSEVGLDIGADQPIYIRSLWKNNIAGTVQPIAYGIRFDNIESNLLARPLFAGRQIENGAQGIILQRATDVSPLGEMITCRDANGGTFFSVNANGFTSVQGLQILAEAQTASDLTATKYLTVTDGTNHVYKLMLAE